MSHDEKEFQRTFRLSRHSPDVTRDVTDELKFYLEMRERELIAQGLSPEEARRRAHELFGDESRIAAEVERLSAANVRRSRARELLDSLRNDARFGLRGLLRAPAFAAVAVITLALGIGANALVFSLIEASLLREPAVRSPETLAAVYTTCRRGGLRCSSSYPDYEDYRDRTSAFEDLAAYDQQWVTLGDAAGAEVVTAGLVTGNYFRLLGVGAARGRLIEAADDEPPGDARVAVLSDAFWNARFGADAAVLGRAIRLNNLPYTVIGIAQRGFTGLRLGASPDVWVPLQGLPALFPSALDATMFEDRGMRWLGGLVARLSEGATIERARAELLGVSGQLAREDSASRGPRTVTVDPLPRYVLPGGSEEMIVRFVSVLQGVVALTLLLACANLANLLLARASVRRRELGVRAAIGAGRGRIVRQLLTESMLLAGIGAVAGLALAAIGLRLIGGFQLPFGFDVSAISAQLNARVIAFTALVAITTVAAFGTLPALHASRGDLAGVLRESRTGRGPRGARVLSSLVGVQVALCVLLLTGAGLFLRTLRNHLETDVGFPTEGVALLTIDPSMNHYSSDRTATLVRDLASRIAGLPGVTAASAGMRVPVRPTGSGTFVDVEGYTPAPDEEMRVEFNYVAPEYFRTLGLRIMRGREFDERDGPGALRVAIINEDMARAWFDGRDPIGGAITFRGERHVTVGVARNTAWAGLQPGGSPFVFAPLLQNPERVAGGMLTFLARTTAGRESALLPGLSESLRAVDRGLAVQQLSTMEQDVATALAPQRAAAVLLAGFGLLALLLACIGIYGVVSYGVAQRRRDFGIRMALGASGTRVVSQVAREASIPIMLGAAAGLLAAVALGRTVRGLIFGIQPTDPLTLGSALAILALAAAAATLVPARRAARTHPMEVMRTE